MHPNCIAKTKPKPIEMPMTMDDVGSEACRFACRLVSCVVES